MSTNNIYSSYFTTHTDTEDEGVLRSDMMYKRYKAYCKKQGVAIRNRATTNRMYLATLTAVCKAIGDLIVDKKNGLYIKGLGYFFVFRSQGHTYSRTKTGKKYYHLARGGLRSRIIFMAEDSDFHMKFWTFENRFMYHIQSRVTEKAKDGFPYIGLPYSIRQLLGKVMSDRYRRYPKHKDLDYGLH